MKALKGLGNAQTIDKNIVYILKYLAHSHTELYCVCNMCNTPSIAKIIRYIHICTYIHTLIFFT